MFYILTLIYLREGKNEHAHTGENEIKPKKKKKEEMEKTMFEFSNNFQLSIGNHIQFKLTR